MCWRALFVVAFKQGPMGWAKLCGMQHGLAFMPKHRDYQLVACSFTTAVLERAVSLLVLFSIIFFRERNSTLQKDRRTGEGVIQKGSQHVKHNRHHSLKN